jgi:hypothetical protein
MPVGDLPMIHYPHQLQSRRQLRPCSIGIKCWFGIGKVRDGQAVEFTRRISNDNSISNHDVCKLVPGAGIEPELTVQIAVISV